MVAAIQEEVCTSKHYSIIIDEAIDISVSKNLRICIYGLDTNAQLHVQNVTLLEVKDGTAQTITDVLLHCFTAAAPVALDVAQLARGASDRSSVIVGPLSGVMTRIKAEVPLFISTHSAAHHLSLPTVDAVEASALVSSFHQCIYQVYTFFSHSTVRTSQLKEMLAVLSEGELKLKRGT